MTWVHRISADQRVALPPGRRSGAGTLRAREPLEVIRVRPGAVVDVLRARARAAWRDA